MANIICTDLDNCNVSDYQSVKRILVPFNDSKHAPKVFGKALTIAKLYGASICAVSIVNKDLSKGWVNGTPSRQSSISLNSVDLLRKGIAKMERQAKKFQIPFDSTIIPSKKVSESILSLIASQKIDLVVMGSKGNAMWKEMLMGRVSSTVAINANCPVLLVK
jgi:nucleotide-binding universal stress UspA family protein